ncbi:MAG: hypothetical protein A2X13_02270 [Bacteroidetes bacterium GWC2_33_15]|nr:MAG: hypothetical protein A2X10_07355 [Bacteroidetes bacterium GWA2_33_15]OFX52299.1 MAG: hypothetical protein A2X13_02270 [Bacteroidetes bacterium GWC2_33_15]OFX64453.1 MAG: hypothetical protein A2X15_13090 [Bacteroidetes bacterium GWB2_32_14]OFX67858.1 MAG: hypothetical protein A2X14_06915 [Bacteroidetes bacterium GWD2_33_33]HAN19477.1 hypothetical protein [Bacteroidales bacterium]
MNQKRKIKSKSLLKTIFQINHYILTIVIIGFTAFLCTPLSKTPNYHVVSFILIFVVSIMATFMEVGPILLAAALSSLVWNFFFIPPHFTFHIDKTEDILMFGIFFVIALLNGVLTSRVRKQERLTRDREERTNALFQLTKELSKASGIDEILTVAINEIKNHFLIDVYFVLKDDNNISTPENFHLGKNSIQKDYLLADSIFRQIKKTGKLSDNLPAGQYTYYQLPGIRLKQIAIAVHNENSLTNDKITFWDTFLTQISNALEREFLKELAKKASFLDESDRLYKTLFNSISHELRIPVATILGASDTLLTSSHSGNVQSALCNEIFTASIRLNRLIENLLNMSRLENDRISIHLDWHEFNDLVNKVVDDLKDELKPFTLLVSIQEDMPLVKIDFGLMEQVLYNLLFNSCQHAPVASNIRLIANYKNNELIIQIMDRGTGFPDDALNNVFNKFFRVDNSKTGGLGLGLSIVKGFVEAHKGFIDVENRKNGGARFTIRIPSENPEINFLTKGKV